MLYSLPGYNYCDLLLGQGAFDEIQQRVTQTLEWYKQFSGSSLLDTALDYLSIGRALIGLKKYQEASHHLQRAVDGLRQAGMMDLLPHGLLARAAFYRTTGKFEKALRDLDEAMQIATHGGMKLFECDAHLAYARLYLAVEESNADLEGTGSHASLGVLRENLPGLSKEHLAKAQALVEACGYHRRDGEVEALVEALKS